MRSKQSTVIPLLLLASLVSNTNAETKPSEVNVELAGHIIIPVDSLIQAPSDAPPDMQVSGKYTTTKRIDEIESLEGTSFGRPTGKYIPVKGQKIQGHSGIKHMPDGTYWVITDNGFGSKSNSPDAMLYLNQYNFDFKSGTYNHLKTIFLHDPDKIIPFRIINEGTEKRYLTGSDLDIESFQVIDGNFWIGDEFGPYLIKADENGKILRIFDTLVDGKVIRSPDNPAIISPSFPNKNVEFEVSRSKGFEGMGGLIANGKIYPMLEGALWEKDKNDQENIHGKNFLRILEFDTINKKWTGRYWKYVLEENNNAIGDFNFINDHSALVIERDNGEGTGNFACKNNNTEKCFSNPAKFKRVYRIEITDKNVGSEVKKSAYIDLMKINDPLNLAKKYHFGEYFTFPFFTIENVDIVDNNHIIVGNDNNYPFSSSREPNIADDNEFILLKVPELLK